MDLAGFDHEDIARCAFKGLSIHGPKSAALPHKLDFVVRMAMRARPISRLGPQEKYRSIHVSMLGSDKLIGAAHKRQVLLTNVVHRILLAFTSVLDFLESGSRGLLLLLR